MHILIPHFFMIRIVLKTKAFKFKMVIIYFTKSVCFLYFYSRIRLIYCFLAFGFFAWKLSIICAGRKLIPEPFLSFLDRHVGSALSGYWILPCQATLAIQPVEGTNERRRDSTWMSILNLGLQPFVMYLISAELGITIKAFKIVSR